VVNRNHVKCRACGRELAIRVTVAGGLQRFVFPCPYCGTQLTGSFYAEQPTGPLDPEAGLKPFEIKSEDFDVLEFDGRRETPQMLSVAINTELPVHISLLALPVTEARLTPFIQFITASGGGEAVGATIERVNVLRQMRFELLPSVRRAASYYAAGDMPRLREALAKVPGCAESPLAKADPWLGAGAVLHGFLSVIGAEEVHAPAREELGDLMQRAITRDADAVQAFLTDFNARALDQHRRGVLDTLIASLEANDALVPGLCLEAAPELKLDEFRIQRADFDEIKSRYQDLFELASRTLVVPAAFANIAHRGDARQFCDGVRRSPKEALRAKASHREAWLAELPAAKRLYDGSARTTRNLIGHRLVSYDYARASLIDDKGRAHNYLTFLRDYLGAVRAAAYMLDVVELATTFEHRGL
jgi:predicted RNA-binding Zn-ribbon protein involved in translation (DUF1610 family)